MPERFVCTTLAKKALYKYSSFVLSFPISTTAYTTQSLFHVLRHAIFFEKYAKKNFRAIPWSFKCQVSVVLDLDPVKARVIVAVQTEVSDET